MNVVPGGKVRNLPETCVDMALAGCLVKYKMDCRVVNGTDRDAVERALNGGAVGTAVRGR